MAPSKQSQIKLTVKNNFGLICVALAISVITYDNTHQSSCWDLGVGLMRCSDNRKVFFTRAGSSVRSATALRVCGKIGRKQAGSDVNDPALHRKTVNVHVFQLEVQPGTRSLRALTDVYSESLGWNVNVLTPQCANTLSCTDNIVYYIHVDILYLRKCLCIMRKLYLFESKVCKTVKTLIAYLWFFFKQLVRKYTATY